MGKGSKVPPLSTSGRAAEGLAGLAGTSPDSERPAEEAESGQRAEQQPALEAPAPLPRRVRGAGEGLRPPARVARPVMSESVLERVRAAVQAEAAKHEEKEAAPADTAPPGEAPTTQEPSSGTPSLLPQRVRGAAAGPRPPGRVARTVLPESFLERVRAAARAEAEADARDDRQAPALIPPPRRVPGDVDEPGRPAMTAPPLVSPAPARLRDADTEPIPVITEAMSSGLADQAVDQVAASPEKARPPWADAAGAPPGPGVAQAPAGPGTAEPPARPGAAVVPATKSAKPATKTAKPARPATKTAKPRARPARPSRSYRVAGLLLVLVAAGGLAAALALSHHGGGRGVAQSGAGQGPAGGSGAGSAQPAASALANRNVTAAWVVAQVGPATTVSCDPVMCRALASRGVPARHLRVLKPGITDPLGSAVIVATPVLRSEIGTRLATVYAPGLLARFGSGRQEIQIRAIAQQGAAAYMSQAMADLAARKQSGTQLARSSRLVVSPMARRELASGEVDTRLMTVITGLAVPHAVDIVAFGDSGPNTAVAPFRSAELGGSHLRAMVSRLRAQRSPFRVTHLDFLRLPTGQTVLRIDFAAPSLFGLLGSDATNAG
jgi:hypothetical protein